MAIVVIRISGRVDVTGKIKSMMNSMGLKKKFSCILLEKESPLLKKIKDYVAFGILDEKLMDRLKQKKKGEYFALPPPKGGLKKSSKVAWPRGILGDHGQEINKLLDRMLY
jgi:ribosomal protein L30/L7E